MSLIRGVDGEPMRQAVLTAALGLRQRRRARDFAEGIETAAERDCLAALGVPFGQGFFLGPPAPMSPRPESGERSR